jgi:hypothetical protein
MQQEWLVIAGYQHKKQSNNTVISYSVATVKYNKM